ncbi:MAG TPA: hypothetical protein VEW42_04530 [Candidatus Eisenbacteria bacterium]|nr:hypothetical protein [Candidatus Eisenbacteria bacterium]
MSCTHYQHMFEVALSLGIFSYGVFFLGLLGFLYPPVLITYTLLFGIVFAFRSKTSIAQGIKKMRNAEYSPILLLGIAYLVVQAGVNSIGLLGPEIGFDAVWYHLTLPKLYLLYHAVLHFPGGVLYYSDMPRLTEMLYTVGLAFGSDSVARGIHFLFGILNCIVVYKIGRKFLSPKWSILLPVIFYSNLVVGWESISGYIDLSRTFFSTTAILAFLTWRETKEKKYFFFSAILVGLTISTKLLTLPDLGIYAFALYFLDRKSISITKRLQSVVVFLAVAIVTALPWFVFAYIHTGNPFYPMFTNYPVGNYWQILNPLYFLQSVWDTFARNPDPINPLFLAMIPFIILFAKRLWKEMPLVLVFAIGGLVCWYITPQTGGGRYILPYLPVLSLVCIVIIRHLSSLWKKVFLSFIIFVACISLVYRAGAVAKFLPVILHRETKAHFLSTHLQYNLGDFYDIDGYFAKHIKPGDTVLLYGFHNLYYVNFPFLLSDWVKEGDRFRYVAVQGIGMPERFKYWNLIYYNTTTLVRVYSLNNQTWHY